MSDKPYINVGDPSHHKAIIINILDARRDARFKAIDSLGRYKFEMFGYHASAWVKYNKLLPKNLKLPNPFKEFVDLARRVSQ